MTHPNEEALVDGYYLGLPAELRSHVNGCPECKALYNRICETLDTASEAYLPERDAGYGAAVWARVSAQLAVEKARRRWLIPTMAAALMVSLAAMWMQLQPKATPALLSSVETQPVLLKPDKPPEMQHAHRKAVIHVQPIPALKTTNPSSDAERDAKLLELNNQLEASSETALPQVLEMVNGNTSDITKVHALFVLAQSDSTEAHAALASFARFKPRSSD